MHPTNSFRKATIVALLCLAACAIIIPAAVSLTAPNTASQASSTTSAPRAALVQNLAPIGSDEDLANQTPIELPVADNRTTAEAGASDVGDLPAPDASTSPASEEDPAKATPDNEISGDSATDAVPAFADLVAQPQTSPATSYNVGDRRPFRSEQHEGAQEFTVVCVAVGEGYTLWIDEDRRSSVPEADLQDFATRLPGIIATEVDTFGDWRANCDVDGDGKAAFVFYPFSGVNWDGFFDESDLYHVGSEEASGNAMDALHLNVSNQEQEEGLPSTYDTNATLSVIAHEFQHLLFFSQTEGQGEGWLNESFSQAAMSMMGLAESDELDELVYGQMETGYIPPFVFEGQYAPDTSTSEGGAAYGLWLMFARYLSFQTEGLEGGGNEVYKTILAAKDEATGAGAGSKEALAAALRNIGYRGKDRAVLAFDDLIRNFSYAYLLREDSGPYSLTSDPQNPSLIDGTVTVPLVVLGDAPDAIPGGGALAATDLGNSPATLPSRKKQADSNSHLAYDIVNPPIAVGAHVMRDSGKDPLAEGGLISLTFPYANAHVYYWIAEEKGDPGDEIEATGPFDAPPGDYYLGYYATVPQGKTPAFYTLR